MGTRLPHPGEAVADVQDDEARGAVDATVHGATAARPPPVLAG